MGPTSTQRLEEISSVPVVDRTRVVESRVKIIILTELTRRGVRDCLKRWRTVIVHLAGTCQ